MKKYHEQHLLEALTKSLGFCGKHAAGLAKSKQSRGPLAYTHQFMTHRVLEKLETGEIQDLKWNSLAPCPVCQSYQETTQRNISFLKQVLETNFDLQNYGSPGFLCFPHFQLLFNTARSKILPDLVSTQAKVTQETLQSLDQLDVKSGSSTPSDLPSPLKKALQVSVGDDPGSPVLISPANYPKHNPDPVEYFIHNLEAGEDCPICLEMQRVWCRWFRWLQQDTHQQEDIQDYLPTCPQHVWAVVHYGDLQLAKATVRAALVPVGECLRQADKRLTGQKQETSIWQRIISPLIGDQLSSAKEPLNRSIECPICNRLETARDRAIQLLFTLLKEERYRQKFEGGYGLCLPHWSYALNLNPSSQIYKFLTKVETAKIAQLGWELDEAWRKESRDTRPEFMGKERGAWKRAVARFSGSFIPIFKDGENRDVK